MDHVGMRPNIVATTPTGYGRTQPAGHGHTQPPPRTVPEEVARAVDGAVSVSTDQRLRINPSKFKDVPPIVFEVMEQQRKLEVELAALTAILLRKELVTEPQLNEYRFLVQQEMAQQFQKQMSQLGRLLGQKPPVAPSPMPPSNKPVTDPRRPPT